LNAGETGPQEPEELLDLVDADDRVIGTVARREAERDPRLIHREIAILVHRRGELLWQLRSAAKVAMPLTWDLAVAGHVAAGEPPVTAAARELQEELGVALALAELERRLVRLPSESYVAHVFAAAASDPFEPRIDPAETVALAWCDEAGLRGWLGEGRTVSPVAHQLAADFWSGRWPGLP